MAHNAHKEAVSHFRKALTALAQLPDSSQRAQHELVLQTRLGPSLIAVQGYTSTEVAEAYGRARELCQHLPDTDRLFATLGGIRVIHLNRGELITSATLNEQLLRLADREQDPRMLMRARFAAGETYFFLGQLVRAQEYFIRCLELYAPTQSTSDQGSWIDLKVGALSYLSLVHASLGYPDQALQKMQEALSWTPPLSDPLSLVWALVFAARLHRLRREPLVVEEYSKQAIAIATEQGFPSWLAIARTLLGWANTEQGQARNGISLIQDATAALEAAGAELSRVFALIQLSEAQLRAGEVRAGLAALAEAKAAGSTMGLGIVDAQLDDLKGEFLLMSAIKSPDCEALEHQAENSFRKSIETARLQQAKAIELKATMGLARLLWRHGNVRKAHALLAPLYHWFTEGFDTVDLREAKALLNELS